MIPKKYIVDLNQEERQSLEKLVKTGKHAADTINYVRILLKADINQSDGGWSDDYIAETLNISTSTRERVRQRFVSEGIDASLSYRIGRGRKLRRLDGEKEAYLLALSRAVKHRDGRERWTQRRASRQDGRIKLCPEPIS